MGGMRAAHVTVALLALLAGALPVGALREIETEETVAELLATPPPSPEKAAEEARKRRWAVLPQVGYGPETGPVGGAKFGHRDLAGVGITLDLDGTYALNRQQSLELEVGSPHLLEARFLALLRAQYYLDPTQDFFGLGNNDVGPDPASTHSFEEWNGELAVGWRPWRQVALIGSAGIRHARVGRGDRDDDFPFTIDAFPRLPGVDGGYVNSLGLALVASTRDALVRPTRGWRVILKVSHTNQAFQSDFEFTRWVADLSYLLPLFDGAHVLGVRLNGGFIDGPSRDTPFWELKELGGDDTLRGFFPRRFLGSQRVLANLEYRALLFGFDFFDIWHVRVEGAAFGGAGRVFTDQEELSDEFQLDDDIISRVVDDFRYDYGGGLRFLLSEALVARVDVGFSEEETGLVYLSFGHTF
jgi:outer membrane protein assembly factor BamA